MMNCHIFYVIVVITTGFYTADAQHWWNWLDIIQPHLSPKFTPIPGRRFTHEPYTDGFPNDGNDVIVNIPKAGMGTFVGFSQRVNYDYTWTEWPAQKGRLVNVFLGIPYAAPPVSRERFRLPRPAYLDTRYPWKAKNYRSACWQMKGVINKKIPNFNDFSEDCLYLNVFYPNRTWDTPGKRYPVVVHIHGGSFVVGSSHLYPGHALASMGTVVVTFNYRLGVYGFLSTGDFASIGNYGLWDQLLAMTWVRDNIWWFRGDPDRITLMGESAGGASVGLHLVSPASRSRGLYHQAIVMSGADMSPWAIVNPVLVRPNDYAISLAKKVGCSTSDTTAMVYCLRFYKDPVKLLNAAMSVTNHRGAPVAVWTPVVDGRVGFMPRMPVVERQQGRFAHVPVMAGVVHDEGALVAKRDLVNLGFSLDKDFTEEEFYSAVRHFLENHNVQYKKETFEELVFRYTWWAQPNNVTARKEQYIALLSDFYISTWVDSTMRYQARFTDYAYFYEFAYRSKLDKQEPKFAIYHGVEIPFVFGFPFMTKEFLKELYGEHPMVIERFSYPLDTNMSEFSMMMWTNFAKYKNPTPWEIKNVTWLPFDVETQNYIHMYINSSIRQRYRQSHFAFWRERFDQIAEPSPPIGYYHYYPWYPAQFATFGLGVLLLVGLIIFIVLVVTLCRKPDPDSFREDETGDPFQAAFRSSYATRQHKKESFV